MHADLVALLNGAAGSRRVMRHLAGVEHGLAHKDVGGLFLFETPAPQLTLALHQLETLLPDNPPAGLAALRTRLAEALAAQDQREHDEEMQRPLSSLLGDDKLEVSEARASDFDKASDAWQDRPATGQPR